MKREILISESKSQNKKVKLNKEEKKIIEKQNRKLKKIEIKKNSLIKDFYVEDCEYYFEEGLRKVIPYYFTFKSFVKMRWIGKSVKEVFIKEFYNGKEQSLLDKISGGYLRINDKPCTPEYCLAEKDEITHKVHRHELPVLDVSIKIIKDDADVLIINKPSSIPVHSVSKYRYNTVLGILSKSHGINQLRVVHRIDRMTSGILMFAKNYDKASKLSLQINDRLVSKYYLAIVKGYFAFHTTVECDQPLGLLCPKLGLGYVQSTEDGGKEASTRFILLQYDSNSDTSLILCKPNTGRTHQIRIHLQYLGHPIISDPLYNSEAWGPDLGKSAMYHKSKEQLIKDLLSNHTISFHQSLESGNLSEYDSESLEITESIDLSKYYDQDCEECLSKIRYNIKPSSLILHLHAYRYRSINDEWDYFTDLPGWTLPYQARDSDLLSKIRTLTKSDQAL